MKRVIDITGNRYGMLVVICEAGRDTTSKVLWKCKCDCGREVIATGLNLKSGNTSSCGCKRNRPQRTDISGKTFGRLTAIRVYRVVSHTVSWLCSCSCGAMTVVSRAHLGSGHTKSCGCLAKDMASIMASARRREKSPRWIPDRARLKELRRFGPVLAWSKSVIERDSSCVVCLSNDELQSHHIYGWSEFPELRFNISNGVTLCKHCHRDFHSTCGNKGFGINELYECFNLPNPNSNCDMSQFAIPTDGPLGMIAGIIKNAAGDRAVEDLRKAIWYIEREISNLEAE